MLLVNDLKQSSKKQLVFVKQMVNYTLLEYLLSKRDDVNFWPKH